MQTRIVYWLISIALLLSVNTISAINAQIAQKDQNHCVVSEEGTSRKTNVEQGLRNTVRFINKNAPGFNLSDRMSTHKTPAFSATVIKNNEIDWSQAYGTLKIGSDKATSCQTLFQAASLSKPVTMMAMMRMHEAGKIDLDKNIEDYLESYKLPEGKQTTENPVTLRNILNHTSGITPGGYVGYKQSEGIPSDLEILAASGITNSPAIEVVNTPGEQLMYSGGAYTLAELAIQEAFDKPFAAIMAEWVLKPAKMHNADFTQPLAKSNYALVAQGHGFDGSVVEGGWHNHPEQAAAGLWANSHDLALLLIEIGKGYRGESKVFSKSLIDTLLANPIAQHAYGFRTMGEGESQAIVHYGGTVGYRAAMVLNLKSGDGAVFLTNSDNGSALVNELLLSVSDVYQWPHFKQVEMTQSSSPEDVLIGFTGAYKFESAGWQVSVEFDDTTEQLALIFPNNDRYLLVPTTKRKNHLVHPETGVEVSFDIDGKNVLINLYGQTGSKQ